MKGLKVVNYYKKILKKYTLENAMEDSLCFEQNSKETKALIDLAESEERRGFISNTCLNYRELLSFSKQTGYYDYLLFIKILADVLNNTIIIKRYLETHHNLLKYHRVMIIPGILNMDFLREGNFVKINKKYYNLEMIFYVLINEKKEIKEYQDLYDFFVKSTKQIQLKSDMIEQYRYSIFKGYTDSVKENIIPYEMISMSKEYKETITLMCMNTHYNELLVNLCIQWDELWNEGQGKGFKYYFPMTQRYIDNQWIRLEIDKLAYQLYKADIKDVNGLNLKLEKQIEDLKTVACFDVISTSKEMQEINRMFMRNII